MNEQVTLYRFELAFEGVPQEVGFLVGLDDCFSAELSMPLYERFKDLPTPGVTYRERGTFWFTEYGYEAFAADIQAVDDALHEIGWSLLRYELRLAQEEINLLAQYQDRYQVALPLEWTNDKILIGGDDHDI